MDGGTVGELRTRLVVLYEFAEANADRPIEPLAREWLHAHPPPPCHSPSLRRSLRPSAHGRLLTRRQSRLRSWTGERGHACTRAAAR